MIRFLERVLRKINMRLSARNAKKRVKLREMLDDIGTAE